MHLVCSDRLAQLQGYVHESILFMERSILVHRKMDAMKLPVRSLTSEEHYQLGGVNLTNNFIVRFTSSCSIVASLCNQSTLLPKLHQYKLEKGERR